MFIQENVSPLIENKIPREGLLRKMFVLTQQHRKNSMYTVCQIYKKA